MIWPEIFAGSVGLGLGIVLFAWIKSHAAQAAAPPIPDHRELKRRQNRRDIEAWNRDYRRLLPPEPPCTSTDHEHIEVYTFGGQIVRRLCGPKSIRR